jgi:hypothetical protein
MGLLGQFRQPRIRSILTTHCRAICIAQHPSVLMPGPGPLGKCPTALARSTHFRRRGTGRSRSRLPRPRPCPEGCGGRPRSAVHPPDRRATRRSVRPLTAEPPDSFRVLRRPLAGATLKGGSVAGSRRGAHVSGGLSHCRSLIVVDQVPPESIRAAAQDIACRASEVHLLAVGTCAVD